MMGNSAAEGMSSALRAREAIQAAQMLQIAKKQSEADIKVKKQQERLHERQANLATVQTSEADRVSKFNAILEPVTARHNLATALIQEREAELRRFLMPGARNEANFESNIGQLGRGVNLTAAIAKLLFGRK